MRYTFSCFHNNRNIFVHSNTFYPIQRLYSTNRNLNLFCCVRNLKLMTPSSVIKYIVIFITFKCVWQKRRQSRSVSGWVAILAKRASDLFQINCVREINPFEMQNILTMNKIFNESLIVLQLYSVYFQIFFNNYSN